MNESNLNKYFALSLLCFATRGCEKDVSKLKYIYIYLRAVQKVCSLVEQAGVRSAGERCGAGWTRACINCKALS